MAFWATGAGNNIQDYLDLRDAIESGEGSRGKGGRAVCDAYAGNPTLGQGALSSFPGGNAAMQALCDPYWNGPDGYAPPTQGGEELPFSGGQCEDVLYAVSYTYTVTDTPFSSVVNGRGPIRLDNEVIAGDPLSQFIGRIIFRSGIPGQSEFVAYNFSRESMTQQLTITNVSRTDGMPDDCGDPEGEFVPAQPGSPPAGTGYGQPVDIGEPGSPVSIVVQPPVITPDGPVFIIEGPGGDVPFSPATPDPSDPIVPPEEGPPQDVSGAGDLDTEDPEGVDETGLEVIGYRWRVLDSSPQFQSVIPGTSPRVYSRVVGSIQLKMRGEAGIIYSDNLQITSEQGSILRSDDALQVVGCSYNVLPSLLGIVLSEIRGRRNDS